MNPVRLAALLFVGAGTALTVHAAAPVDGSFAAAQLLKNAKSFSVEVDQHFVDAADTNLPFVEAGVPSIDIIDLDYPQWHTAQDDLDRVSARSLQIVGEVVLDALPQIERQLTSRSGSPVR